MAIKYLSGKRIQGLADLSAWNGTFSGGSAWTKVGGGTEGTNEVTLALDTDTNQDSLNYDLGASAVSNDDWVIDFTLNFSRLTIGTNIFWFMGLVNSTNWIATNNTNHMGIFVMQESGTKQFGASDGTGTWNGAVEDAQTWAPSTGVDYYFRLTKLTSTSYKVELFADSARTSVTSTSDGTVSAMTDLRYLTFAGDNNSGTGNATFKISDIKFYNDVTTPPAADKAGLSNIETYSIFEELDTGKYFWYSGSGWLADGQRYTGERGLIAGGYTSSASNEIQYISISTLGNAADFGDLTAARTALGATHDATRGCFGGGESSYHNEIDYVTILTAANAVDFGDLTQARKGISGVSSDVRGVYTCGENGQQVLDYITIQSTGNATDFGDPILNVYTSSACHSLTRGVIHMNATTADSYDGNMEYITIATAGNCTDFGGTTVERSGTVGVSDLSRGLFAGGKTQSGANFTDTIDYITIGTTSNATDFGNLTAVRNVVAAVAHPTRAVFCAGWDSGENNVNIMEYVTIATAGNATDFGDCTAKRMAEGCSDIA